MEYSECVVPEPVKNVLVGGVMRAFPTLGSRTRLDATDYLREVRLKVVRTAAQGLSESIDPDGIASGLSAAVRQGVNSTIVEDREIQAWMTFSPEGRIFLCAKSLMAGNPKLSEAESMNIVDLMDDDQIYDVSNNIICGVYRKDAALHRQYLYPERYVRVPATPEPEAEKSGAQAEVAATAEVTA
jgi:hypothetical protein